jgi:hypothetical protein
MNKTTMKLDITRLTEELKEYRKFRKPSKYKDNKATVLIALKPPRCTRMCCYGRVPTEHTYTDSYGGTRTYTRYEKDECPYHIRSEENQSWSRQYICALFGGGVGYRGTRLDLCKFVFGKSKKMIKSWRPLKEIENYITNLTVKKTTFYIDRLLQDTHINASQHKRSLKALKTWASGEANRDDLDRIITTALYDRRRKVKIKMHMGCPTTEGGSYVYSRWN